MKNSTWRLGLLAVICASGLSASPCITGSLASYIALVPNVGCTINAEIVDNFAFTASIGAPVDPTQITVTPSFTATKYQLLFTSTGFSETSGNKATYEIDFNWDPLVGGAGDDMEDPPMFPGSAAVTTTLCAGCPLPFGAGTNTLNIFDNAVIMNDHDMTLFASPVLVIGTKSVFTLDATTGGLAQVQGFDTFVFVTPEPATMILTAAALLLLPMRRLHRR